MRPKGLITHETHRKIRERLKTACSWISWYREVCLRRNNLVKAHQLWYGFTAVDMAPELSTTRLQLA
jgi:hypothetical protein